MNVCSVRSSGTMSKRTGYFKQESERMNERRENE
jgi:hypothetical protein